MPKYNVTLQIFAATGDDIEVEASDEREAERLAQQEATKRYLDGSYTFDLQEVCINCVDQNLGER
jgi:hypothetical protein